MIENDCGISTEHTVMYVATAKALSDEIVKDFERRANAWTQRHGLELLGGGVLEALEHGESSPTYRLTGIRLNSPFPLCERVFVAG
jgi:hypothetical protein